MPRTPRSVKELCVQTVFFVLAVTVFAHLSFYFWERCIVRGNITELKNTVSLLKKSVSSIGSSYDILHDEVKTVFETTVKNGTAHNKEEATKLSLDRRTLHDKEIQAFVNKKHEIGTENLPESKVTEREAEQLPKSKVTKIDKEKIKYNTNHGKGDYCLFNCIFKRENISGILMV